MKSLMLVAVATMSIGSSTLMSAQAPSAAEVAENARRQQAATAYAEAERTLAIRLLDRCIADAEACTTLLSDTQKKADALTERLVSLGKSDEGKRLAAGLDFLSAAQVQRLIDEPPVAFDRIRSIDKQLASASAALKKQRENLPAGFVTPDAQQDELNQIAVILRSDLARLTERAAWLDSMISTAPGQLDLNTAPTLDITLAELRRQQQKIWNDARKAGVEQAQPEAQEQITAAARTAELEKSLAQAQQLLSETRAELERQRLESEMRITKLREEQKQREDVLKAKLVEAEAARAVQTAQNEVKLKQGEQNAELIRKRQECRRPEVLSLLQPLTTPGYWQPNSSMPSENKQPLSLSQIRASGATAPGMDGLRALFKIGANVQDKVRPRWPFRTFNQNFTMTVKHAESYEQLQQAQKYLIDYGDALVAEGLLTP